MIARVLRAAGPWATPVLVAAEVVLVWSGLMAVRTAVVVVIGVEVVLAVTVAGRAVVAIRRFRAGRASGVDGWAAAEDGLAAMIPRRAAHLLLIEPRLWISLARWISGRHDGRRAPAAFRYDGRLRPLLWVAVALVVVEGAAVELVLALTVHQRIWLAVSLALHLYAVFGLVGILAGFATRPHVIEGGLLRLRDGVFTEILVPTDAIRRARRAGRPSFGRSGPKVHGRRMLLAHGDADVELTLDAGQPITVIPSVELSGIVDTLSITVDDPGGFLEQLAAHRRAARIDSAA